MPNRVNCCKHGKNLNICKNLNFKQETREEVLFTEVPNCFYKIAKLFPVFYREIKPSISKGGQSTGKESSENRAVDGSPKEKP